MKGKKKATRRGQPAKKTPPSRKRDRNGTGATARRPARSTPTARPTPGRSARTAGGHDRDPPASSRPRRRTPSRCSTPSSGARRDCARPTPARWRASTGPFSISSRSTTWPRMRCDPSGACSRARRSGATSWVERYSTAGPSTSTTSSRGSRLRPADAGAAPPGRAISHVPGRSHSSQRDAGGRNRLLPARSPSLHAAQIDPRGRPSPSRPSSPSRTCGSSPSWRRATAT